MPATPSHRDDSLRSDGSASQEAATDATKSGKPDVDGAPAAVSVEPMIKEAIEVERETEREFWREVIGEVVAVERRKVDEFGRRLDDLERRSGFEARQLARDETKRGPRGERGAPGERGPQGERGARGEPGRDAAKIASWELDAQNYLAAPVMSDGTRGAALDFKPLLTQFLADTKL
jgi:hypothetical protein